MSVAAERARSIAHEHIQSRLGQHAGEVVIDDEQCREEPFGWVFFYDTAAYLESRDPDDSLVENAPVIVDREGRVHETWSSEPLDEVITQLREDGELP